MPTTDEPPTTSGPDDRPGVRDALLDELARAQEALGELLLSQRLEPLLHTRLTVQQLRALAILQLDGETSAHRLADVMGVTPATVSGIVDRLETAGMVTRRPDPTDGRVRLVAASERGTAAVRRMAAQDEDPTTGLASRIDTDDLRALTRGVLAVLAAARAEVVVPPHPGDDAQER